jgi:hypothetical protein
MKKLLLIFAAPAFALMLRAQDVTIAPASPSPAAATDNDPAAHQGYPPDRYSDLWTKSPFAVETPDEVVTDSAEYSLVGVAQLGDVTYASLIEKQNQAHLLVSTGKPLGGLTLNSISNKSDGVYVMFTHDGQPLTLKLEAAPAGAPQANAMPGGVPVPFGGVPNMGGGQSIPMPGSFNPANARPLIRIRRPTIHVPPRFPSDQTAPPGQPTPPPGTP